MKCKKLFLNWNEITIFNNFHSFLYFLFLHQFLPPGSRRKVKCESGSRIHSFGVCCMIFLAHPSISGTLVVGGPSSGVSKGSWLDHSHFSFFPASLVKIWMLSMCKNFGFIGGFLYAAYRTRDWYRYYLLTGFFAASVGLDEGG